jgi:hypothetical protein
MESEKVVFRSKSISIDFPQSFNSVFLAYEALISASAPITILCALTDGSDIVEKHWLEISDFFNHEYLSQSDSSFERWNTYLIFFQFHPIRKKLQYEIENNKLYMRKLVMQLPEDFDANAPSATLIPLIGKKILLSDVRVHRPQAMELKWTERLSDFGQFVINSGASYSQTEADKESRRNSIGSILKTLADGAKS